MGYIPSLSYKGNQVLISSGRVLLHAKDDSILLFGKKAIAISSLGSVNIDVSNLLVINSPKIELGLNATEPVILGNKNSVLLTRLLDSLTQFGGALAAISETELEKAFMDFQEQGYSCRTLIF